MLVSGSGGPGRGGLPAVIPNTQIQGMDTGNPVGERVRHRTGALVWVAEFSQSSGRQSRRLVA